MPSLFLAVNVDWFFLSHRLPIALEAKRRGYDVTVIAIDSGVSDKIRAHGLKFIAIPTSRSGLNILTEIKTLLFFISLYRKNRPDVVHHVAMKPVIYGSLAARVVKIKRVVNALSGMGFVFIDSNKSILKLIIRFIFRIAFSNKRIRFIFQNRDDLKEVAALNILDESQCTIIKGSGVDLNEFGYLAEPENEKVVFSLPARMLYDKGIVEFIEAAQILEMKYPGKAEFILAGMIDMENKAGIKEEDLLKLCAASTVKWIGHQTNVLDLLKRSNVVVLPSYREGLPKTLIEACAVGRSIVTTNVPGCRDVVTDGHNGFVVEKKQVAELAAAMEKLLLSRELRIQMGIRGRAVAEKEFSIDNVIDRTMNIYIA